MYCINISQILLHSLDRSQIFAWRLLYFLSEGGYWELSQTQLAHKRTCNTLFGVHLPVIHSLHFIYSTCYSFTCYCLRLPVVRLRLFIYGASIYSVVTLESRGNNVKSFYMPKCDKSNIQKMQLQLRTYFPAHESQKDINAQWYAHILFSAISTCFKTLPPWNAVALLDTLNNPPPKNEIMSTHYCKTNWQLLTLRHQLRQRNTGSAHPSRANLSTIWKHRHEQTRFKSLWKGQDNRMWHRKCGIISTRTKNLLFI